MIFSHCPHEAGRRLIDRPGTPAPLTTTASTRQRTRKRPAAAEHTHDAPGPEVASMHLPRSRRSSKVAHPRVRRDRAGGRRCCASTSTRRGGRSGATGEEGPRIEVTSPERARAQRQRRQGSRPVEVTCSSRATAAIPRIHVSARRVGHGVDGADRAVTWERCSRYGGLCEGRRFGSDPRELRAPAKPRMVTRHAPRPGAQPPLC